MMVATEVLTLSGTRDAMKKQLLAAFCLACCTFNATGQGPPVYRLIYSPAAGANIGPLGNMSEVQPGLFYALSHHVTPTSGDTIISVSTAGTFKAINVFSSTNNNTVLTLVEA